MMLPKGAKRLKVLWPDENEEASNNYFAGDYEDILEYYAVEAIPLGQGFYGVPLKIMESPELLEARRESASLSMRFYSNSVVTTENPIFVYFGASYSIYPFSIGIYDALNFYLYPLYAYLAADADENYLTTFYGDVIILKAAALLSAYLKEDNRFQVLNTLAQQEVQLLLPTALKPRENTDDF